MAEHSNDYIYERQLFAVFESCLTKGQDELDENDLFSICNKLHLHGLIEELKSCIRKHCPDKQTISFQEFRDGLLLLLKKFQGLTTDKQHIVQPCYNSGTCDAEKSEISTSEQNISEIHLQNMKTNVTMDENRLTHMCEKVKVYLRSNMDPAAIQFMSNCLGIPELPKQITESIFERLDQNCDGLINFDEFVIIFQNRKNIEALQLNNETDTNIVNCDVNTLDFTLCKSRRMSSVQLNRTLDKEEVAGVSNITVLSSNRDLSAMNTSLAEITSVICNELKNLNESFDNHIIQAHITLLQEMVVAHQDEQRNLNVTIENIKVEREKMRIDMLEANERANLLVQEIDECQVQLEQTKRNLQRQSEQRYAEITKELSDQFNIEREINAAALKSKDDQLQALQKENHDMKNKIVNMLQENQMLEAENKSLLNQIEKLRQSNNDLLTQIKVLDAEQDEIHSIEAKQQEQVNFFVDRIKQLQSEIILLRDQNDELSTELENSKCYGEDIKYETSVEPLESFVLLRDRNENHASMQEFEMDQQIDAKVSFDFPSPMETEQQIDVSNSNATEHKRLEDTIIKDLENVLSTNTKCVSETCTLRDSISRLIANLQSNFILRSSSTRDFGKSIASELEMECEERTNESLRDLVVSKTPKSNTNAKRITASSSMEDFTSQDVKNITQTKMTSLRDYPPRKEEHSVDQCKNNKEKINSSSITEAENIPKSVMTKIELFEIEKKQLIERCQELERSLDLLKAEYEECEDYWAAKLEEERQLFEQEQKMSDDKLAELINKIVEYEELISPSDKSKNSDGRLSPIEEKFTLEQQYIALEEEFEKWRIKTENDISQKNLEIGDLREKLRLVEQPITNDSYVQVPDEIFLPTMSDSSHYKSSSTSSIPSTNEPFMDLCGAIDQTLHTSSMEFLLSNDSNRLLKQDHVDGHNLCSTKCCEMKEIKIMNKHQKIGEIDQNNSHINAKAMIGMKEENKCDSELKFAHDVIKEISCPYTQNNAQQHVGCVNLSVLQDLKMKLYTQEHKKRYLQRYVKQQRQSVEKLLQHIMVQHQSEVCELQCLLRNSQERLQIQVQTTIDQADKLASADILVKDLYIENAYLTAHMKRLQERCLALSGLNVGTTSM
ncbi:CAP-Gly domain-containing linker protein 1 [Nylanderia fulva]|uniref:CAP-Gly domain-containing linker protein 1 n=1 Tax=Nylanderia fulva TaxID=613905 RepID=UPI0010FB91F8|nr:CAP-Gly domain-containing linker protein 1 [Nylanderia fulva]